MTAAEKRRMLAAILDTGVADAEGLHWCAGC
jgi:hypothetical protein